jgi:hypothetical protein
MPTEPLTAEERAAFIEQMTRIGEWRTDSMLAVRGVKRFSALGKFDRAALLEAMRKVRR